MPAALKSPIVLTLAVVLLLGAAGAALKLATLGTIISSDYQQYVATAQLFGGEDTEVAPQRLLKPLAPLLILAMGSIMDYETAVLVQALLFFALLLVLAFFFAYEFFRDRFSAAIAAILIGLSYPVLKYGVELNTETGALCFYILSLFLTLKFLRQPTLRLVLLNALVITFGFLWKEYSVVCGMVFGLALIFHSQIENRVKAGYVAVCAAVFLLVHLPWQLYVYLEYDYSYLSWYTHNVSSAIEQREFTLFNIVKSTAALLGVAWLAVPLGLSRMRELAAPDKLFLKFAAPPTFIAYFWGYVSSRLLYVMAPAFVLLAVLGMRSWERRYQIAFAAATVAANLTWLLVSNRFTATY